MGIYLNESWKNVVKLVVESGFLVWEEEVGNNWLNGVKKRVDGY